MPRKARIDAPGALHHIMARGIEKNDIFYDDFDRNTFVDTFGHRNIRNPNSLFRVGINAKSCSFAYQDRATHHFPL